MQTQTFASSKGSIQERRKDDRRRKNVPLTVTQHSFRPASKIVRWQIPLRTGCLMPAVGEIEQS
jgi:hypothetical protein